MKAGDIQDVSLAKLGGMEKLAHHLSQHWNELPKDWSQYDLCRAIVGLLFQYEKEKRKIKPYKRILSHQWLTIPLLHRNALRTAKKWLKTKNMNRELTKEEREAQKRIMPNRFCIHCEHKKRVLLKHGAQIYCEMQPSPYSSSGYRTIKAHDFACGLYEQRL